MKARRGLGKGLGALIPLAAPGLLEVEVDKIGPNPRQPRQSDDLQALQELAESLRQHGMLQPLLVTAASGGEAAYQLVAGQRRWEAAKRAGLKKVPVMVLEATPQESLLLALVENLQRADLAPLEEAAAYRRLMEEFGLTQEEVAAQVGKSRPAVANALRLFNLPPQAQEALAAGKITAGHARALISLPSGPAQLAALRQVMAQGLSVRQTEALARRQALSPAPPERTPDAETQALEEGLQRALGTRVSLYRSGRGGKLVIYFYSEEELQALYEALTGR